MWKLQILEAIGIDFIDESECIDAADELYHVDKTAFKVPSYVEHVIWVKLYGVSVKGLL